MACPAVVTTSYPASATGQGICFDGTYLYLIDTAQHHVVRYDFPALTGATTVYTYNGTVSGNLWGPTLDFQGFLYVLDFSFSTTSVALVKIDLGTLSSSSIATFPVDSTHGVSTAIFHPTTDSLFIINTVFSSGPYHGETSTLYEIDKTSGAATSRYSTGFVDTSGGTGGMFDDQIIATPHGVWGRSYRYGPSANGLWVYQIGVGATFSTYNLVPFPGLVGFPDDTIHDQLHPPSLSTARYIVDMTMAYTVSACSPEYTTLFGAWNRDFSKVIAIQNGTSSLIEWDFVKVGWGTGVRIGGRGWVTG